VELTVPVVLIEHRRGVWEASVPWARPLADPIRAPHRTAAEEEIVHRLVDALGQSLPYSDLDTLAPPENLFATPVEVDLQVERSDDQPPVQLQRTVPVVAGTYGDDLYHAWIPTAPGERVAAADYADLYSVIEHWAGEWADTHGADSLEPVSGGESLELSEVGVEVPGRSTDEDDPSDPRLERPDTLQEVATNLTHLAAEGTAQRAWERESTVETLVETITGTGAHHVCLVGPPGTGKTAIIEEAVRRAYELETAYQKRHDLWRTSGDQMVAGMRFVGQWQNRAARVCDELAERGDVLVVEDLLGFARAGPRNAQSNLARFFEPEMAQNSFAVIAEATERTLDTARTEAPGFVEAFRRIHVPPTDRAETFRVANAYVREVESNGEVAFTPEAVEAAVEWCDRYFRRLAFPGKAVRLIEQCIRDVERETPDQRRPREPTTIDIDFVAGVIHRETGLPRRILRAGEGRTVDDIRDSVENQVYGQPDASRTVSRLIAAVEQGLCNPMYPLASLLLIGPSGVGKTETAKTLAAELFGSEDRLIRFDMSEFSEPGTATRLIGTPSDPDGELTGRVRIQPHAVLLFDEIEKAHRSVLDLLLQVLGEGRLSDASGRTVDFSNTVVAMTSNLGADREGRETGFRPDDSDGDERGLHYRRAAEDFFRPEFFNRIDSVVPYRPLDRDTLRRIARTALEELLERRGLRQPRIMVDVAPALVDHVISGAVDQRYGARTLKQRIERELLTPLARQMTRREEGRDLTRVRIVPGDDAGIELEIRAIEPAPRAERPETSTRRPPDDAAELEARIDTLLGDCIQTLSSDDFDAVDERHETLLRNFNVDAESPRSSDGRAEQLRQLEIVRQQRDDLERRLRDHFDEGAPEEPELPDLSDFDRTRLHEWDRILRDLRRHLRWLRCQLQSVAESSTDAATLVVSGLSGPAYPILSLWTDLLDAFADRWDLELARAVRRGTNWSAGRLSESDGDVDADAVALSAEHPGVGTLFDRLAGYLWAPKPPTHGRHALALGSAVPRGTTDPDDLLDLLDAEEDLAGQAPRIEFELESGQLRDVRLELARSIPDSDGKAMADLADDVVFERLPAPEARTGG